MMTDLLSHNGKAYFLKRIYMHVSVTESLCCIAVINTTLYINCTSIKENNGHTRNGGWQDYKF